jgi:hypothetical protein
LSRSGVRELAINHVPNPEPADGLTDGDYFASGVATDDHREHGRYELAEGAIGELPIHGVEAGGFNTNEDLTCRRLWYRELGDPEGSSVAIDNHGFHAGHLRLLGMSVARKREEAKRR